MREWIDLIKKEKKKIGDSIIIFVILLKNFCLTIRTHINKNVTIRIHL